MSTQQPLNIEDIATPGRPIRPRGGMPPTFQLIMIGLGAAAVIVIVYVVRATIIGANARTTTTTTTTTATTADTRENLKGKPQISGGPTAGPTVMAQSSGPPRVGGPPTGAGSESGNGATPSPQPQRTTDPEIARFQERLRRDNANAQNGSGKIVPDGGDATTPPFRATPAPVNTAPPGPPPVPPREGGDPEAIVVSRPAGQNGSNATGTFTGTPAPARGASSGARPYTAIVNTERTGFLSASGEGHTSGIYHGGTTLDPISDVEVFAGTPIHAELDDGINTSQVGPIYAHLTQPVRSSIKPFPIVFPAWTRLQGRYNASVNPGDTKIQIAWDYMIIPPSGDTYDLGGMPAADNSGENGLTARVDDHKGRIVTATFLSAVLSAGLAVAQPQTSVLNARGIASTAAGAAGTALSQSTQDVIQAQLAQPPTLTVERGRKFVIRLRQTITPRAWNGNAK